MMNALIYYFFCLIAINCFIVFARQEIPTVTFTFDSSQTKFFQSNVKHGIRTTYNSTACCGDCNRAYYASLSPQDFQQVFQQVDINEILNQYPLYAFENFLTFVSMLPEYEAHILLLHENITSNKAFRKQTACMPYFTYSFGLRYEKSGFHDFIAVEAQRIIDTQKQKNVSTTPQSTDYAKSYDLDILAEYKTLSKRYRIYVPCLSSAVEGRINAFNSMTKGDYALQYTNKLYSLNDNVKQLLNKHGHNITRFTQCYGHQLHQILHQEALDLLDRIDTLSSNSILYDHQDALVEFTLAMADYNHENEIDKAMHIGDFCWTLLDYGKAIAEGVVLGAYSAITDLLYNPFEALFSIIVGKQVLTYQLCKVLYNVADISITALINTNQAKNKWNKYTEPLNNLINHINEKTLSVRDVLKGGTAFVVGYKAQSTFLGGLGKFCNTIQQKATRFVQNNISSFTIQQYLATPEGYLLRSVAKKSYPKSCPNQYDKLKQWLQIREFTSIVNTTRHGIERLIERGFTSKDVYETLQHYSFTKLQKDGSFAYIKQLGNNFNVIIFNQQTKKIITAIKNIDQKSLNNLGKKYDWQ